MEIELTRLRRTMQKFYENREYPTLKTILARLKEKIVFFGGKTTLSKVLKKMGFRFSRRNDRSFLYERRDIIESRHNYLRHLID